MEFTVNAIYENGSLQLPAPLDLPSRTQVTVRISHPSLDLSQSSPATTPSPAAILLEGWDTTDETRFLALLSSCPNAPFKQFFSEIHKVAPTTTPVLIYGERGTKREKVVSTIHRRSNRKKGPFISFNCSIVRPEALEEALFPRVAENRSQPPTLTERALNGTLFLDEIEQMPAQLQVRLMQLAAAGNCERSRDLSTTRSGARLMVAIEVPAGQQLSQCHLRADFVESMFTLRIPPLRDWPASIPELAKAFLRRSAPELGTQARTLSQRAIVALARHQWPGNDAELEQRLRRALLVTEASEITPEDLELESGRPRTLRDVRDEAERDHIVLMLEHHRGKVAPTASALGISRPTLYELMKKHSLHQANPYQDSAGDPGS